MKNILKLFLFGSLFFSVGVSHTSAQFLNVLNGKRKVNLNSEPQGAIVSIDGQVIGLTPCTAKIKVPAPMIFNTPKNDKEALEELRKGMTILLTFSKDGYESCEVPFGPDATMRYPSSVFHSFEKGGSSRAVNRSNPGATDLERTIIRWYFESEPQGARIFWRVISSCPDEVKNTNELWLGNTPFEETRSFNIQGLTYENSRDVQIEIKVKRNGYLDQTKRFNVRQAIDQQEISSFFDMIKAEEE
ncbi:MAG: PEGA domain-containing protein [Rikenellaceae bacterium]|nr:PEGA domain-containing protein [Rikenellaceae bacterium]